MVEDVKKLHYKECKYRIAEAALIFPDKTEHKFNGELDLPYFIIAKDFDNEQYPFFSLAITVNNSLYKKMRAHSDELKFRLNMRYAMFDTGEISANAQSVDEQPFLSKTFFLFLDDLSPYTQDPIYKEADEKTAYGTPNEDDTNLNNSTTVRVSLYDPDAITIPKKLSRRVLHNVTITDAMTYLLQAFASFTKILMTPSTNSKMYDQFILPPEQYDYQIDRIANEYGLHDNGSLFFFDFDRLYITEKVPKCTAWEPNEVKKVYIVSIPITENAVINSGAYYDSEANEIYLTSKTQVIESQSLTNEIASGSGILVINKRTGLSESFVIEGNKIKAAPQYKDGTVKYDKTIVINTGDDTITALRKRLNEKAMTWNIYLDNTMLDALKPNREYNIVFTDSEQAKKYNGTYRLVRIQSELDMAISDAKWRGVNTVATFIGSVPDNNIS
jgi:hypothetical protein